MQLTRDSSSSPMRFPRHMIDPTCPPLMPTPVPQPYPSSPFQSPPPIFYQPHFMMPPPQFLHCSPPVGGGMGGTPPSMGGTPPSMGGTPPGMGGTPPGMGGTPPGMGGTPPSMGGTPPSMGGTLPGMGGTLPGIYVRGPKPPPEVATPTSNWAAALNPAAIPFMPLQVNMYLCP